MGFRFSCRTIAFGCGLVWLCTAGAASASDGLVFERGDHRFGMQLESRFRLEGWDAHALNTDWFTALRSRAGLLYTWRDLLSAYGQFQDARINRMSDDASGAGALYRASAGGKSHTHGDRMRQLWLELRPIEGVALRGGRQDIKLGLEVGYPEPAWKYLKGARLSQRLVGGVGWTHGERSNDGAVLTWDLGDYHLYGFGAKPTTGVFDINSSYAGQDDITYGGGVLTAKRGTWIPDSEVRIFGLAYRDDRSVSDGGLLATGNVDVYTAGLSLLGVRPVGEGNFDLLLWGAYQWGDWYTLDHQGWAALAEVGYQFTERSMAPWLRAGVNIASGDRSPNDGDHESFFNLLPTNHLYYGYADRFALANLIDYFAQLKLSPFAKVGLELFVHHFQLYTSDDGRHFGSGAYDHNTFGYGIQASGGHRSAATEIDAVVSYKAHDRLAFLAGYSFMEGHAIFNDLSDDDVRFAFFQVTASY